jgi:hypothetical protein
MSLAFVFAISLSVLARDVIEVESRYLGNGCFQYTLRTLEDPFVTDIFFGYLGPQPFTNYVSNTLPPHWTNSISEGNWWGIAYDASVPQPRVNETSFSVCSSSTSFRREQYGFQTTFAFLLADCFQTRYWAGTFNSPCLVPCAPEEADGSDHQMVFRFEIVPDLVINQLIVTNGEVHGVTFSWVSASTVELQGSHDLSYWTPVARLAGYSPATTWTTNSSLNACGKFFRLRAISVKN